MPKKRLKFPEIKCYQIASKMTNAYVICYAMLYGKNLGGNSGGNGIQMTFTQNTKQHY